MARTRVEGSPTERLKNFEDHLTEACLGQISEIFDGDPPHTPRGCNAQAWASLSYCAQQSRMFTRQDKSARPPALLKAAVAGSKPVIVCGGKMGQEYARIRRSEIR